MKKQALGVATACALVLGLSGGVAWAQTDVQGEVPGDVTAQFHIPFSFVTNGKALPAGRYDVTLVGSPFKLTAIQDNTDGYGDLVRVAKPLANAATPKVEAVFDEVGGQHYLYEIRVPGTGDDGAELPGVPGESTHAMRRGMY